MVWIFGTQVKWISMWNWDQVRMRQRIICGNAKPSQVPNEIGWPLYFSFSMLPSSTRFGPVPVKSVVETLSIAIVIELTSITNQLIHSRSSLYIYTKCISLTWLWLFGFRLNPKIVYNVKGGQKWQNIIIQVLLPRFSLNTWCTVYLRQLLLNLLYIIFRPQIWGNVLD